MHFGQANTRKTLLTFCALVILLSVTMTLSCKQGNSTSSYVGFKFPEQGAQVKLGDDVKIELDIPQDLQVTEATYMLDGKVVGNQKNGDPFTLKTAGLSLGYRLISAVIADGAKKDTLTVNIEIKSAIVPPVVGYKVVNVFPHDTTSYTQGLEYHDGRFLESTGEYGFSTLRWVELKTGKALQKIDIDKKYFAEGVTLIGNKVVLLTWQANMGFIYDAKTFQQTGTFPYQNSREGWGLTFNGEQLIKSDGTNRIWFLNKDTFKEESFIEVYDNKGQVDQLNELEYIDGKIYANIYQTDNIAIIDPKSGAVERYINLSGILPAKDKFANTDVLNGIAWDAKGKRLFVTGKKFDKLFEIVLVP
jgi:glutamine cyclotransferase